MTEKNLILNRVSELWENIKLAGAATSGASLKSC